MRFMNQEPEPQQEVNGFYEPTSESEICQLIQLARKEGRKVRVIGSGHSVKGAIYASRDDINIRLNKYNAVMPNLSSKQVTVQAGCYLGANPRDPAADPTYSLLNQLEALGWALPDLGGITHQTVGGFMSTGSSGGSMIHAFEDAILEIRLIDGTGAVHVLSEQSNPDLFHAAGVSMGLLGILSTVTLQCEDAYDIAGKQTITGVGSCPLDLAGDGSGKQGLEDFLTRTEYARLMWWPQHGAERMLIWQAKRVAPTRFHVPFRAFLPQGPITPQLFAGMFYALVGQWPGWLDLLLPPAPAVVGGAAQTGEVQKRLFRAILEGLFPEYILPAVISMFIQKDPDDHAKDGGDGSGLSPDWLGHATQGHVNVLVTVPEPLLGGSENALKLTRLPPEPPSPATYLRLQRWTHWLEFFMNGVPKDGVPVLKSFLDRLSDTLKLPKTINVFVALAQLPALADLPPPPKPPSQPQRFTDTWRGLAMDNEINGALLPTQFTELWIPLASAPEVMDTLRRFFKTELGFEAGKAFSCEVYAAKRSRFWMSPAYGRDVVRIDMIWFGGDEQSPIALYRQIWQKLRRFDFRLHWGKHLSDLVDTGPRYLRASNPEKWDAFMGLRQKLDPDQLFVTDYWRMHLDIPGATPRLELLG